MRRTLLAALAALTLLPALAAARAVVVPHTSGYERTANTSPLIMASQKNANITRQIVNDILRHMNPTGFDIVQPSNTRTSLLKDGYVGTTQYDAIVLSGLRTGTSVANGPGSSSVFADSFVTSDGAGAVGGYMNTKPILMVGSANGGGGEQSISGTASNSLICTDSGLLTADPGYEGPGLGGGRVVLPGTQLMWPMPYAGAGTIALCDTTLARDGYPFFDPYIRPILASHFSNWSNAPFAGTPPTFRDSLYDDYNAIDTFTGLTDLSGTSFSDGRPTFIRRPSLGLGTFTLHVWEDGNQKWNDPTAAPIVYIHWACGGKYHIGGNDKSERVEGDPSTVLAGMAFFDSLTSHALFGESPLPYSLAVQVSGLATSGGMYLGGGGQPVADSTGQNMAMDSLRTSNIPITGLFRADSIFAFQSQFRSWVRHGFAVGIERYANSSLTLSQQRDTLAYYSALYGATRFDRVLGGNKRDFTATELGVCSPALPESVSYAIRYAGFTGMAMNAEEDTLLSATNTPAWNTTQRVVPAAGGSFLNVWAYPGYNHRGATNGSGRDSMLAAAPVTTSGLRFYPNDSTFVSDMRVRTFYGMMFGYWHQPIKREFIFSTQDSAGTAIRPAEMRNAAYPSKNWAYSGEPERTGTIGAKANLNTGTNIVRISASNLGSGQWGTASPNMPGWYQVKYTVNTARAINQLAGRTLVRFVYPDQLTPKDMQR